MKTLLVSIFEMTVELVKIIVGMAILLIFAWLAISVLEGFLAPSDPYSTPFF